MATKTTGTGQPFGALTTNQSRYWTGPTPQALGTPAKGAGNMGLTAAQIAQIQPYLNFNVASTVKPVAGGGPLAGLQKYSNIDLSKVVAVPVSQRGSGGGTGGFTYQIPAIGDTGRGGGTAAKDITAYVNQLKTYNVSRVQPSVEAGKSIFGTEGALWTTPSGGQFNVAANSSNALHNPWANTPGGNTLLQDKSKQFAAEHPGYFQVGQDPNKRGSYDRGALDTNNLPSSYFPGGTNDPNALVKYDPKYGYIAPNEIFKRSRPDFLDKYGKYIPLAFFGAGLAMTAAAGAGGAAAAGAAPASAAPGATGATAVTGTTGATGGGLGGLNTVAGTFGTSGSGIGGGLAGTSTVGGTFGTGGTLYGAGSAAGAAGAAGGATGAAANLTSGAGPAGNSSGGSQGLFASDTAAPITQGTPTSFGLNPGSPTPGFWGEVGKLGTTALGSLGSAALGGGGGGGGLLGAAGSALGGGGGSLISTLIGAGLSVYQAREMAKALEVQDKSTDYSRTSGGHTSFDPSIRALQDESLAKTAQQETGVMGYGTTFRARSDENKGQYDKLYRELTSNQNPFIQARVNPLKEQIAGSRGQIQRNQGLRGVGGSSFGNDELTNFDFGAQRQLGDAGSMATQEALGARGGVLGSLGSLNQNRLTGETQLTNSLNTLNSNRTGIAHDRANLERAGLGLSADSEADTRLAEQKKQEAYMKLLQGLIG